MKSFRRIISLAIATLVFVSAISSAAVVAKDTEMAEVGEWNTTYQSVLTGDPFNDIAEIALAQEGKTASDLGLSGQWCARFVSECASIAGQSAAIPYNAACTAMYYAVIQAGGEEVSTPQKGDLVFFYYSSKDSLSHVGIVTDSGHNVSGNIAYNGTTPSKVYTLKHSSVWIDHWFYVRPAYSGSTPITEYESIENGEYYLKNVATGQYLSVDGGYDAQAQNVSVADFTGGNEMKFEFVSESNGYALRPLCSSSRMLNIYADNVVSGKNVCIYDNTYHSSQRWKFEAVEGGYIVHSSNNPSCVLDVSGTNVQVSTNTGADSQKWVIESENTAVLPDKPTLAVVPGTSETDTQFTWEETANTDSYTLHIYNKTEDWKMPLFADITDLYINVPLPEGEYSAWVASINDELKDTDLWYTVSDAVDFSVEGVHYHEYYVLEENPGDCQNHGYTIYQCDCGESYIEESTEFGDHIPSEWTVIFMPTETERGLACKLCTLCNVQTEYLRFDDEDNMFYPETPEEPEDPGYDYPMTFTIDAEINDSKTGDILFSWNEHTGVSYYNLKVINYAIEEELNVDVYDTSFLWEDVTCDAGMFTIAAMDEDGNMLGESALVKFERMFIMGDWWGQYGDADLDGKINIKDATVVQKVCAKFIEFDDTAFGAANVNYDDKINIKDATAIQKYLAHIESDSRVGEEYFYGFTQYEDVYLEL